MERNKIAKIENNEELFSYLFHNHAKKIIIVLVVFISLSLGYFFTFKGKNIAGVENQQPPLKENSTLKIRNLLEDFIETNDIKKLKSIFNNPDNIDIRVFPPGETYDWKINLKQLPQEVNDFRDIGEPWKIKEIISIDTLTNERGLIEIEFTNK